MHNVVIQVENLSKEYRLGVISHGVLYKDLQSWWARVRGKEDPNSQIDAVGSSISYSANDRFWALNNVSFEVKQGEVIGIIGRNGAGKSTLLKIISQVTAPTKGIIKIKGRVASLLEVGTGFHPELTGRENIYLNGSILGMTKREISKKFDEIINFAEIEKFIDTPVKRYSSGMYVRLAFAVAAHLEPEILIVDEVLAVGDAIFQKKCLGKMKDISKGGKTVLFVSHNMSAINLLCQKCLLLDKGNLLKEGPSQEIISHYLERDKLKQYTSQEYRVNEKKQVQIRRVVVRDDKGNMEGSVDLNRDFIIQIDYDVKEKISNISIGLQIISNENEQCLISLSDPELEISRLGKREIGYYINYIKIPGKILNTGTYKLRVGVTREHIIYDVVEDVFFSVIDSIGIVQCLGFERKNSLLSIQLPWKVIHFKGQPEYSIEEYVEG